MAIWTEPATILPALTGIASVFYYLMITRKSGTETEDIEQLAAYGFNYFPTPLASAWLSTVGEMIPKWPTVHMKEMERVKLEAKPKKSVGEGVLYE